MQGFALNNISDCYVGSNQVSAVYLGSTLIWPTTPPQPHDYSQDYLTIYTNGLFQPLGDITFTNRSTSGTLYYDEGDNNWRQLNGTISTVHPLIRLKGNLIPGAHQDPYFLTDYGIGRLDILSSHDCNICGNIMSLLYGDNFVGQTSLLGYDYVFTRLFYNNSDIISAENLVFPNDTSIGCYYQMFAHCTNLNYIKCLATDISATNCLLDWLNDVSATGTFVKDVNTTWPTGASGIPSGWTTQNVGTQYNLQYLTFEALEPTTFSFSTNNLQYSLDNGSTWTTLTVGNNTPQLAIGDKILWKQTGLTPNSTNGIGTFSATGNFNAYGNIMSLYYGDNFVGEDDLTRKDYAFKAAFYENIKLIDASNLILPATTLANNCYWEMFNGCTSLTTAPKLPATTLTTRCYNNMFRDCESLTTAPKLPATTLVSGCYRYMFIGCESLNNIKCLATSISASNCTQGWISGVAASGTFIKDINTDWSTKTGINGIPSGWTVINV